MKKILPIIVLALIGAVAWAVPRGGEVREVSVAHRVAVVQPEVAPPPEVPPEPAPEPVVETQDVVVQAEPFNPPYTVDPGPTPGAAPRSACEIDHADNVNGDFWGAKGMTEHPRGTVFTFTLSADGRTWTVPLVARAGSIVVNGVLYGPVDGYTDAGQTNFGNTSADMPMLPPDHGPVTATVTLDGQVICSA